MARGRWSTRTKVVLTQVAVVVGLIVWFKLGLPGLRRHEAASRVAEREQRIENFVHDTVGEDTSRTVPPPGVKGSTARHPQWLIDTPSRQDVEEVLGAPQTSSTDFRGGEHLTWIGTRHSLEASFNHDRLYALTLTDLKTGHGATILQSRDQWRAF